MNREELQQAIAATSNGNAIAFFAHAGITKSHVVLIRSNKSGW